MKYFLKFILETFYLLFSLFYRETENKIMIERKFNLIKGGKKRLITHIFYKGKIFNF